VPLDESGIEISDYHTGICSECIDFEAFVWAQSGDSFIDVCITELIGDVSDWNDPAYWPWFRIGLSDDLIDAGDVYTTRICVNIIDFEGFNELNISNEASPLLSFTGDDEIGHMAPSCSLAESLDSNELVFETGAGDARILNPMMKAMPPKAV